MSKKDLLELFNQIRKDDQATIDKLISMNERILYELRDLISTTKDYIKNKEVKNDNN